MISTRMFYLLTLFALIAISVVGFLSLPAFNSGSTVSAQTRVKVQRATPEMLSIALDFRTATDYAVFAEKGITDAGNSKIMGDVGVSAPGAEVKLERASVQSNTNNARDARSVDTLQAQKDLAASFNAIKQLPCVDVTDAELGGRKFTPGVYCLSSARLAGQVILDAESEPNAIFLFRIAGSLNTEINSSVELINKAQAPNVFFVAGDSINVGEGNNFKGSLLAENSITVNNGASISGKVLSVKGDVSLSNNSVQVGTGTLEVCKAVDPNAPGAANLNGRIFQFRVGSLNFEAQAGFCSGVQTVTAGPVVIEELNTSRAPGSTTLVTGNFQATDIRQINQQPGAPSAVTSFNLPLRTANVTVPEGDINSQVIIQFTNQFSIVAFVEICKQGLDSDVSGFFRFTIDGVPQQTSLPAEPLTVFTTPVGKCTGPIAVTLPSDGTGNPRQSVITIRELTQPGFFFVGATTSPADRLRTVTIVNNTTTAGIVTAQVFEANGTSSANQTVVNFFNRSNPGIIKVCKVAGPGVTEGTAFSFTVTGTAPVIDPTTGAFSTTPVSRTFDVSPGPAAQGGFCRPVPDATGLDTSQQTFVVGTNATITENGPTTNANGNEIRVSRITSSSGFVTPAIAGNVFFPPNGTVRTVTVPVRIGTTEVEFTNFVFVPGQLKVCKVGGNGVPVGTSFTFDVTFDRLQGTFPTAPNIITRTVTIPAGPAVQGGVCMFIDGPFTPTIGGFQTFNVGTLVTVTERPSFTPPTLVTSITTSSGGALTTNLLGRTGTVTIVPGTLIGGNVVPGVTEIEFVNTQTAAGTPGSGTVAPTAAAVSVSGRVTDSRGRGIRSVVVSMIDGAGVVRTATSTSFGYYQFTDIPGGDTYIFTARAKHFSFRESTQVYSITEDTNSINFIAIEQSLKP